MQTPIHRALVTLVALGAVALVVAGCDTGSGGPVPSAPPGTDLTVVVEGFTFDTDEIRLTAGEETLLFFVNRDGDQHNIAIYPDADGGEPLFRGDLIADDTIEYRIPPLEPGTYHFQCDPHAPIMNGTVIVDGAGG